MDSLDLLLAAFAFIFGTAIGSFLNVCIHRMPRQESIALPPSHCPECKTFLSWKDNIPLLSYLFLKARCRYCHKKISPRYFFTELVVGLIWLSLWLIYGVDGFFVAGVIYFSILLAVTLTDLETGYIPDKLSLPGIVAGLVLSLIFPSLQGVSTWYWGGIFSLVGVLVGGGSLLLTGLLGNWAFKKDTMGGGDIKLVAMIGAFVGWKGALLVFFLAPLIALPVGLYMRLIQKKETIVFGPYLALIGAIYFLYRAPIDHYFFQGLM